MIHTCEICGVKFEGRNNAKSCSVACRKVRIEAWRKEWVRYNVQKLRAIEKKTRVKRASYRSEYKRNRASTRGGYLDRVMGRVRLHTPDTDLSREFLDKLLGECCALSGVPFIFERGGNTTFMNPYAPTLDRIDSNVGYMQSNVHWVLAAVNFAKNQMSLDDFKSVWKDITSKGKLFE